MMANECWIIPVEYSIVTRVEARTTSGQTPRKGPIRLTDTGFGCPLLNALTRTDTMIEIPSATSRIRAVERFRRALTASPATQWRRRGGSPS